MNQDNYPKSPLDLYRKKATFDQKKLQVFLDTEEVVNYQQTLYDVIRRHPILYTKEYETPSLQEQKRLAALKVVILNSLEELSINTLLVNLRFPMVALYALFQVDPSAAIKNSVSYGMFPSTIQTLGTKRHAQYLNGIYDGDIIGSYCLTEIGHGSNAKFMQTTATFDKNTQEFILHTPNFEAAKCWAASVGYAATHALVYAQLITPDGKNHSLHSFVVKIRDTETLLPCPGVRVGDMGEKIGLNGIDNGVLMFDQYRIPKDALLNKTGDVTIDGNYITPFRDSNKKYGASLGALSMGRVTITSISSCYLNKALTIAIRYAAVRKQFGPEDGEEIPILEYQSHQHRLIPYLAVAYALKIFASNLMVNQYDFAINTIAGQNKENLPELGLELHAISSASKPVASWVVRDGIQECREACAGHGYLKVSGIGDIKNSHEANCTYEGENHVLIQQTSNWLLKFWPSILQGENISSPLQSINFLNYSVQILNMKFNCNTIDDLLNPQNIINMFQWLVCFLLKSSYDKCEKLMKYDKLDQFSAKNESQVYFCKNLAIAYVQHCIIQDMHIKISEASEFSIKNILSKLFALYGLWSLEKHISIFYLGGYTNNPLLVKLIQDAILKLCGELKNESVALIDVIAPPDFLMNSVLGQSDGLVYKHLEEAMLRRPGALQRAEWWNELIQWKNNMKSKL